MAYNVIFHLNMYLDKKAKTKTKTNKNIHYLGGKADNDPSPNQNN